MNRAPHCTPSSVLRHTLYTAQQSNNRHLSRAAEPGRPSEILLRLQIPLPRGTRIWLVAERQPSLGGKQETRRLPGRL